MIRSCRLFHGPGARSTALIEAAQLGRLLHEPFGDEGLKADEAREFVGLMQCPPVGEDEGVVIAGPMDHAAPKSSDVLLKSIEEPNQYVHPILWATDLGGVAPTIRSRCLSVWCPVREQDLGDELVEGTARELLNAVLTGNYGAVPALVAKVKATPKLRSREPELVAEVVEAMSVMMDNPKVFALWERVRELASWRNPTQIEVIAAFLAEE